MARYKHTEFSTFAETGKKYKSGNLTMVGEGVYSYHKQIAKVDRATKTVTIWNGDTTRTTNHHRQSVVLGIKLHLDGDWKCVYTDRYL